MSEYIDRKTAKAKLCEMCRWEGTSNCEECEHPIDDIPPADVRPVVLGRWVGNKRHQSCSECHMTYCVPDGLDGELDMTAYHFCPNCGARMEGTE